MQAEPKPSDRAIQRIGLLGLYVFALFAFLARDVASAGLFLMFVAALLQGPRLWKALGPSPLPLLALATVGLITVSSVAAALARADDPLLHWYGLGHFLQLWLFLLIAWWVAGRETRAILVLTLALFGFVLGTLDALGSEDLELLLAFRRPHFRWSINAIGQYCAAGLLGIGLLWNRLWRWSAGHWWGWCVRPAVGGIAMLLLAGTVLSLSRGVWLALAASVCGLAILAWQVGLLRVPARLVQAGLLAVAVALVLLLATDNPVTARLVLIVEPFSQYISSGGDLAAVKDPSFVVRFQIIELALDSWRSAPWLGLGPGGPEVVMTANRDQFQFGSHFTDFHSLPIDLLVSFGLLGTVSLLAVLVLVLRWVWVGYRSGCLAPDLFLLLMGLTAFNVLCQLTDTRLFDVHGRFFWILVSGVACSCWLRHRSVD